jgi:hypothetical protein
MAKNILIFSDGTGQAGGVTLMKIVPTFTNYFEQRGVVRIRQLTHQNRLPSTILDWALPEIIISLSVGLGERFTI